MRKRKVKLIYVIIVIAVFAAALLLIGLFKDSIVISNGIRFFRSIRTVILTAGVILTAAIIVLFFIDLALSLRAKKNFNEAQARVKAQEEENIYNEKKSRENLSVSKNMDSVRLRQILSSYGTGQWQGISDRLGSLSSRLDMMDEQQRKLDHLIENNGAQALSDTQRLLDEVEQYLCRSVRKVINYMDVADAEDPDDVSRVEEKIYECNAACLAQLDQVQEFLFAFADYLNTQGDDDSSIQKLDLYKTTILDSIKE